MIHLRSLAVGLVAVVAFLSWQPASSYGQFVRDWDQSAGGTYSSPFNWNPINVPNIVSESAWFNINNTYDVLFSTNRTVADSCLAPRGYCHSDRRLGRCLVEVMEAPEMGLIVKGNF